MTASTRSTSPARSGAAQASSSSWTRRACVLDAVVGAAGTRPIVANPAARVLELVPGLPAADTVTVICNATEHELGR